MLPLGGTWSPSMLRPLLHLLWNWLRCGQGFLAPCLSCGMQRHGWASDFDSAWVGGQLMLGHLHAGSDACAMVASSVPNLPQLCGFRPQSKRVTASGTAARMCMHCRLACLPPNQHVCPTNLPRHLPRSAASAVGCLRLVWHGQRGRWSRAGRAGSGLLTGGALLFFVSTAPHVQLQARSIEVPWFTMGLQGELRQGRAQLALLAVVPLG